MAMAKMERSRSTEWPERSVKHDTFTLERTYKYSPEQVFHAWAEPEAKRRWFASEPGWEATEFAMDFRVGGREQGAFRQSNGPAYRNETVYLDIAVNRRIVFAYSMAREADRISASLGTVEILPDAHGTRLIYTEQGAFLDDADHPDYRRSGWTSLLDRLGDLLSGEPVMELTRIIEAPRELVWKVWNDPDHARHWGPHGFAVELQGTEVREGAPWRARLRSTSGGDDLWQGGLFREVVEPERLVYTFAWDQEDGSPGEEMVIVLTLMEFDGKTKLTLRQFGFASEASRDGHAGGWGEALDNLKAYIEKVILGEQ